MGLLNAHQQVFALSMMANLIRNKKGTQEDLQSKLEQRLPLALLLLGGKWDITWGPVVWKHKPDDASTGPDHVWFVARNPSLKYSETETKDTYVTAVAATATDYNWVVNNARVDKVVDFHKWLEAGLSTKPNPEISTSPENCYIAYGTALGVYHLASMKAPDVASKTSLETYWASFPKGSDAKVIFTGHSLGGALSPSLAWGFSKSRALESFKPDNILVYPTAGPSPGNLTFAQFYAERFPKVPGPGYQVWNCNIVNKLDIVSQAWCISYASPAQNMNNIPDIYGSPALPDVEFSVSAAQLWAFLSGGTYIPIQAARFSGTEPASRPGDIDAFLVEARKQHIKEFLKEFIIPISMVTVLTDEEDGIEAMSQEEADSIEPVLQDLVARIQQERLAASHGEGIQNLQVNEQLSEDFV